MSRMKSLEEHGIAYDSAEYQNNPPPNDELQEQSTIEKVGDNW